MKYRVLWSLAIAGVGTNFAGMAWDALVDDSPARRDGLAALSQPGFGLLVAGLALTVVAVMAVAFTWISERRLGGNSRSSRLFRGVSVPLIGVSAAASIWLAIASGDVATTSPETAPRVVVQSIDHDKVTQPGAVPAAVATDESAPHGHDADPLSQDSAEHAHGTELAVTGEQLRAAADFQAKVQQTATKYQDVKAALAAGYIQITQDLPGIAAHFFQPAYNGDRDLMNPEHPEILLYSKRVDGTWRLVGAMFSSETVSETPPAFFGPIDVWHRHENLCFIASGVTIAADASACRGTFVKTTAWNLHVWTMPGATGVFAHDFAPISPGAYPGATLPAATELRVQAR
jgi:hypothetical protein